MATALRAFASRNFRIYWTGLLLSLIGTWMQNTAQSWLVYRLTKSELYLGLASFSSALPILLLSPLAGWVADHYPRRKIVMWAQAGSLVQAALLAVLTLTGHIRVEMILVLAFVLGCLNAFEIPARQSLAPALIPEKEDLLNAISLNAIAFQSARFLGPALAGLLIANYGEGACFLVNSVSFVALMINLMRLELMAVDKPTSQDTGVWEAVREGVHYVRTHPHLRLMIENAAGMGITTSALLTLAPALAGGVFHQDARGYGLMQSALSVGAIVALALLASRPAGSRLTGVVASSGLIVGTCYLGIAAAPAYGVALAILPVAGFGFTRQNTATNTFVQVKTDELYRGRVLALFAMSVMGTIPFGSMLAGTLAHAWGPRVAIAIAGLMAIGVSLRFRMKLAAAAE